MNSTITIDRPARQSIETKYLPPTIYNPAKIVVKTSGGIRRVYSFAAIENSIDKPLDYITIQQVHSLAAKMLIDELDWGGNWHCGATKTGFVFVTQSTK